MYERSGLTKAIMGKLDVSKGEPRLSV
jgi:hypothetical protein